MRRLAIFLLMVVPLFAAGEAVQRADSSTIGTPVEISGKVAKIQLVHGQGMPYLEVERDGKSSRVVLGSMRYLMSNDFNPKAGEEIRVAGFRASDGVVYARTVTLKDQNRTLRLRDEEGQPLWRPGHHGRRMMQHRRNHRKDDNR